jgi:hypothetical protein
MQSKLLRVEHPGWCAGVVVHRNGTWGRCAPILRRIIGKSTPKEFLRFLDGIGKRNGWKYQWL